MKASDDERFADFVRANTASLFRTAYLMTGDYHRAEDVLQAALVRVCQRWSRVDAMQAPVAYARRVVISQASSWWRRRSSHEWALRPSDEPAWDGRVEQVAEHHRVWQAVLTLPPRQRAVTVLRYYEDLSETQIAEILGMAPGTVKSHSHAANRRLAGLLGEPGLGATRAEEATS